MKKLIGITLVLFLVAGCASSIMNGFVGKSLPQVMVKYGPPLNAFDMGDGRRAFQWIMTNTYVTPMYATTTGNAFASGNSMMWSQNTQIGGGVPITDQCAYTMYGRWHEDQKLWIMEGFEPPNLMCE